MTNGRQHLPATRVRFQFTMNNSTFLNRLAVCSWSLQPTSAAQLCKMVKEAGLSRIQIALDPLRQNPDPWKDLGEQCRAADLQLISGMFGTMGEDYTTMDTIRRTGGIVPDGTWDENWTNIRLTAQHAKSLGLDLVTFHAGFLPHEPSHPDFVKLRDRLRQVADVFAQLKINLALETGQETADTLKAFLEILERPNVGVNFDPANMILYEKGDPISALKTLQPWIFQCHIKDAILTTTPGTWGAEVPVGTGQVDWTQFFQALKEQNFTGWLPIEREAGGQRIADVRSAQQYLNDILH